MRLAIGLVQIGDIFVAELIRLRGDIGGTDTKSHLSPLSSLYLSP